MRSADYEKQLKLNVRKLTISVCGAAFAALFLNLGEAQSVHAETTETAPTALVGKTDAKNTEQVTVTANEESAPLAKQRDVVEQKAKAEPADAPTSHTTNIVLQDAVGNTIDSESLSGETGQTKTTSLTMPKGWTYAGSATIPAEITFGNATPATITVPIKHKMRLIKHDQWVTSSNNKTETGVEIKGAGEYALNKRLDRVIYLWTHYSDRGNRFGEYFFTADDVQKAIDNLQQDDLRQTFEDDRRQIDQDHDYYTNRHPSPFDEDEYYHRQIARVYRDAIVDEVTGEVTYTPWTTATWAEYKVPQIRGFVPKYDAIPEVQVTGDMNPIPAVNVYYYPAATVQYKDKNTGKIVKEENIKGEYVQGRNRLDIINVNLQAPRGYDFVDKNSVPKTYTFRVDPDPLVVLVERNSGPDDEKKSKPGNSEEHELPALLVIQYKDVSSQQVLHQQLVPGKRGDNVTINYEVPSGYHVVGSLPSSEYTFTGDDQPIIIWVKKDQPSNPGEDPKEPEDKPKKDPDQPGDDIDIDLPEDPEIDGDDEQTDSKEDSQQELHDNLVTVSEKNSVKTSYGHSQYIPAKVTTRTNKLPQTGNNKVAQFLAGLGLLLVGLGSLTLSQKRKRN